MDLVGAAAERQDERRSIVLLETAGEDGAFRATVQHAPSAVHFHEQPCRLTVELGAVDLDRRGLRWTETAFRDAPCLLPVEQLEYFEARVDAREVGAHPGKVGDSPTVAVGRLLGPVDGVEEQLLHDPEGADHDAFVVELAGDQLPAPVLVPDQVADRHTDVVVVHRVRAVVPHGVDPRHLEALGVRRNDDDRDSLVGLGVWIRSAGQPDVVGVSGEAGPDLLTTDDVLVAIAPCRGLQRGQVRPRAWLAVPNREVALPGEDPREVLLLLRLGPEFQKGRPDRVEREDGHRKPGAPHFIEKDELFDRSALLAAVLLGPAHAQPSIRTEFLHCLEIKGPAAVALVELDPQIIGHQVVDVSPNLVAKGLLLWRVVEEHDGFPRFAR